jgi:hypothetical protein
VLLIEVVYIKEQMRIHKTDIEGLAQLKSGAFDFAGDLAIVSLAIVIIYIGSPPLSNVLAWICLIMAILSLIHDIYRLRK